MKPKCFLRISLIWKRNPWGASAVFLAAMFMASAILEVDAFLADKSPEAYEKVVDRLLASPHYGERWARPWLDLARYADTNGYEKDNRRTAWKYRDWVINALNQDMSFREFTIEQLAGDMLPNPTTAQLIATSFHRNTMLNQEGGIDHMEYYWYSLVDRANTTASVWLGSTLACAQCHNHKFDPFTQKDYYRMLAFFDNAAYQDLNPGQGEGWVEEPSIELPTPEQEAKAKELRAEIAKLQQVLDNSTPELEAAQANWERQMKAVPVAQAGCFAGCGETRGFEAEGRGFTGCGKLSTGVILSAAKDLALRIFLKMHRARFFSRMAGSE